jgi:hypothetical protein
VPGYNKKILISSDYGENWVEKESNRAWYSIDMSSTGQYMAAGTWGGNIYVSTDYGENWTAKTGYTGNYVDISISGDGKYMLASRYSAGPAIVSNDYGSTWDNTGVGSGESIYGVALNKLIPPEQSPTPTPTSTGVIGSPTPTPTLTPTRTVTPTVSGTYVPASSTPTPTITSTPASTPGGSPVPTLTPTKTPASTPTLTPTKTPASTPTLTPTKTPASTPTLTPTKTPTPSPTASGTFTIDYSTAGGTVTIYDVTINNQSLNVQTSGDGYVVYTIPSSLFGNSNVDLFIQGTNALDVLEVYDSDYRYIGGEQLNTSYTQYTYYGSWSATQNGYAFIMYNP